MKSNAVLCIWNDHSNFYVIVDIFNHMDILHEPILRVLSIWTRANGQYNLIHLSI